LDLSLKMNPNNWIAIIGVIATIAIIPNPSTNTLAPSIASATPPAYAKMKVAVIGPEATPPESKPMPTNNFGTKKDIAKLTK
jgi:hypothetical protein